MAICTTRKAPIPLSTCAQLAAEATAPRENHSSRELNTNITQICSRTYLNKQKSLQSSHTESTYVLAIKTRTTKSYRSRHGTTMAGGPPHQNHPPEPQWKKCKRKDRRTRGRKHNPDSPSAHIVYDHGRSHERWQSNVEAEEHGKANGNRRQSPQARDGKTVQGSNRRNKIHRSKIFPQIDELVPTHTKQHSIKLNL
jgi:hypothetical protein